MTSILLTFVTLYEINSYNDEYTADIMNGVNHLKSLILMTSILWIFLILHKTNSFNNNEAY